MTLSDYYSVRALLNEVEGVVLREADSRESIARYLARNPGLSLVAKRSARVVGCLLCGHDGRRGYLQYLAVDPIWRRRGIASALVGQCLQGLRQLGILKIHVDVLVGNEQAHDFWSRIGWLRRDEIVRYSITESSRKNA